MNLLLSSINNYNNSKNFHYKTVTNNFYNENSPSFGIEKYDIKNEFSKDENKPYIKGIAHGAILTTILCFADYGINNFMFKKTGNVIKNIPIPFITLIKKLFNYI